MMNLRRRRRIFNQTAQEASLPHLQRRKSLSQNL
jgi:hypothetical protein